MAADWLARAYRLAVLISSSIILPWGLQMYPISSAMTLAMFVD